MTCVRTTQTHAATTGTRRQQRDAATTTKQTIHKKGAIKPLDSLQETHNTQLSKPNNTPHMPREWACFVAPMVLVAQCIVHTHILENTHLDASSYVQLTASVTGMAVHTHSIYTTAMHAVKTTQHISTNIRAHRSAGRTNACCLGHHHTSTLLDTVTLLLLLLLDQQKPRSRRR